MTVVLLLAFVVGTVLLVSALKLPTSIKEVSNFLAASVPARYREDVEQAVSADHPEQEITADDILGRSLLLALCTAGAVGVTTTSPLLTICLGIGAGALPYIELRQRRHQQRRSILQRMPDLLDTTALLLSAGSDLRSAVAMVADPASDHVLDRQLRVFLMQLSSGDSVDHSLSALEDRLDVTRLRPLFASMRQALTSGAALAPLLRDQSIMLRDAWFEAAEKQAAEAAVKMTLPLLLIFAAVLLIVLGPLAVQFLGGV